MKIIGRLVARPNKNRTCGWDLALLIPFKSSEANEIKPNTVYELYDFEGEIFFKEIGPSCFDSEIKEPGITWGKDIHSLLGEGNRYVLTKDEFRQLISERQSKAEDEIEFLMSKK